MDDWILTTTSVRWVRFVRKRGEIDNIFFVQDTYIISFESDGDCSMLTLKNEDEPVYIRESIGEVMKILAEVIK